MSGPLFKLIVDEIVAKGSMRLDRFMDLALGHPVHGYYMTRDPFGRAGDFTTAPEISQMFGEVIGALFVEIWRQMGAPAPFHLLECGPGRGTLMADMLRVMSKSAPDMLAAVNVHMLEMSPVLKARQAEALAVYNNVTWHEHLSTVPADAPLLMIGNEFLDALPIRQFIMTAEGWRERAVGEGLQFVEIETPDAPLYRGAKPGEIYELAPARTKFMQEIFKRLKTQGGYSLWLDYGYTKPGPGDTLQALRGHKYVPVLEDPGQADITAHVDFAVLAAAAKAADLCSHGPVTQGEFLQDLGIEARAAALSVKASPVQQDDIEKALHRLTHSDEMGALFKVIGFSSGYDFNAPGF